MRYAAVLAAATLVGSSVLASGPAAQAASGTLDQSNTATPAGAFGAGTWGQTFLAGLSGGVSTIELQSIDGGGDISVTIQTLDSNGAPSGTVIGSGTATAPTNGWFSVPITSTAGVAAGTSYAFVYSTATAKIAFNRGPSYNGSDYLNGAIYNGTSRYDGYDFLFREYVSPLSASVSGTPTSDVPVDRAYFYSYAVGNGASTSVESGTLPPGITLSSAGVLSGTPTLAGSYAFTVRATLDSSTATTTSTIVVRDLLAPGQPTEVTAAAGNGSATVEWTAPTESGDDAITGYTVTATPGGISAQSTSTSVTVTGLTAGTSYSFSVTATSDAGTGAASEASGPVTPYTSPGAPRDFAADSRDSSVVLSWAAPASDGFTGVSGYFVEQSTAGGAYVSVATLGPTERTATVEGLTNGTSYSFRITAANVAGTGEPTVSNPVVPAGLPGAPRSVSVLSSDGTAVVSFTAPSDNGGAAISGYVISYRTGIGAWTATTVGPTSPATITGLVNGATYDVVVSAVTAAGTGLASDTVEATPFDVDSLVALEGSTPLVGSTVTAGDSIHLYAAGLPAGAKVEIELHSVVTTLASLTIGADGILDRTVTIPTGTPAGSHHLVLIISGTGLDTLTTAFAFTVEPEAAASVELATTGGSVPPGAAIIGLLALLGGVILATVGRLRSS